ncbi:RNA polymerase subunit sigma-24 [Mycolicibacterium madagascariense]|uniref:RNA polymerase subunit sigma-24 n=1 Tax=Mycolicibacterium madagascariense TaxID=212765 RepID=A0A7I7X9I7_9MYCO|nr:sigma-70 family RNA polymerase sigma factor [Mycolicibacterium madagascariense]BBZ26234.1 RNA polymerase subunit sigma-24 [Mycolicibacterium madagascariense]
MTSAEAVTAAWRAESARLVAALVRMTSDIGLAEDAVQDALVSALEEWPQRGIPANPAAWLMTAAKRRAIDQLRRAETLRRKTEVMGRVLEEVEMPDFEAQIDFIDDDVLRLMFLTCHPALSPVARAALTLRLVSGLSTAEIARAFVVSESTMGQRISRAKKTLASVDMELPTGAARLERVDDVLAAIYLTFNEGYVATSGDQWTRPDLCFEAVRLARMVAVIVPDIPDVLGLQALLEIQACRIPARINRYGAPVLLGDQNRARWDQVLRRRGIQALARAEASAQAGTPVGTYFLQAAIAACHARAARAEDTDWRRIADLYDVLARAAPGPVVEVNRAVAYGRTHGPEAGLAVLDALGGDPLPGSPLPHAVRGDLLARMGRDAEARAEFARAAELTRNAAERSLLLRRAGS